MAESMCDKDPSSRWTRKQRQRIPAISGLLLFPFYTTWAPSLQGGTCHIQSRPFHHELHLSEGTSQPCRSVLPPHSHAEVYYPSQACRSVLPPHRHAEVYVPHSSHGCFLGEKRQIQKLKRKTRLKRRCGCLVFRQETRKGIGIW